MVTKFARTLAEYLTTDEGKKVFADEYEAAYADWFTEWTRDEWGGADYLKGVKFDTRIRAIRYGVEEAAYECFKNVVEVGIALDDIFNGVDEYLYSAWQKNYITRAKNWEPLAQRIDKVIQSEREFIPADWR